MYKQDLKSLSAFELSAQIDEVIKNRRYKNVLASTNTNAVFIAWVFVAVLISLHRYLTL